jgi:hypothetical protein
MREVPLTVFSCPKLGTARSLVRFLGGPRGIITHWGRGRPLACPGPDQCKDHRNRPKWKGYAPGQLWRKDDRLWVPYCIEMTPGLVECTGTSCLRGQCWEIFRVKRSYGDRAVEGNLVREYNSHDLPQPFDVVRTVETMYGTLAIEWDVPVDGWIRERAECSTDDNPPVQTQAAAKPVTNAPTSQRLSDHLRMGQGEENGKAKKT